MSLPAPAPLAPATSRPPAPPPWAYLAAALAYFAVARFGLWSATLADPFSPIWLGTGLSIWLTIRFGPRILFAVAVGEFAANGLSNVPSPRALATLALATMAAGNILTAYFGAWLWQRGRYWREHLDDFSEPVCCLVTALAAPLVSATVGVSAVVWGGGELLGETGSLWITWWLGDAIGALFFLPLLLAAPALGQRLRQVTTRDAIRGAFLFGLSAVVATGIFGRSDGGYFLFALFPLLLLATVWFDAPGARLLALILAVTGTLATARGHGPFATGHLWEDLRTVQAFLSAAAVIALLLPGIHHRKNLLQPLPLTLLLGGWALGGLGFSRLLVEQARSNATAVAQLADDAEDLIARKLTTYIEVLRRAESFVLGAQTVSHRNWHTFAQSLQLSVNYPGLSAVGIVYPVTPEETEKFLARVRADGAPDFALHALPGATLPATGQHLVLTLIEPTSLTEANAGVDLASNPVRLRALEAARDTGRPQIALRTDRRGFVLYLPVYDHTAPQATVTERRAALKAWINAPFLFAPFLKGVLGTRNNQLDFHLYEAGPLDAAHLISDSDSMGREATLKDAALIHSRTLYGQDFTFAWFHAPFLQPMAPIWLGWGYAVGIVGLAGWVLTLQTARAQAENLVDKRTAALRQSEERFELANQAAFNVIWDHDLQTGRIWWNEHLQEIYGYSQQEMSHVPEYWRSLIHPDDRARVNASLSAALTSPGNSWASSYRFLRKDGSYAFVNDRALIVRDPGGRPVRLIGAIDDLTAQRHGESALRQSEGRLRALFNAIPDLIFESELNGTIHVVHSSDPTLLAAPRETMLHHNISEVLPAALATTMLAALAETLSTGKQQVLNYALTVPTGEKYFEARIAQCTTDSLLVIIRDITEQKQAAITLQSSLHEKTLLLQDKTALLKEVHHRVKNNLQVITSLLRLESHRHAELSIKSVLMDMQGRIRTMAHLHETLYQTGTFATVDLGAYLRTIITESFRMLNTQPGLVRLVLELACTPVTMEQATPCGLLVNELISNCLKHGFPGGRGGEVRVELQCVAGGPQVCLRVSDTGVGLPPDFAAKRGQSLGLQLVSDLCEQLHGQLAIGPEPAAVFAVTFTPAG
ncbi:MAG: CHASE domain-containing protein [Opitutae bacterium]